MSDELKGRGQVGELIARIFKFHEKEKLTEKEKFKDHDPFIQT